MKRIFLYIMAIIAIVGCQKNNLQQEIPIKGETLTALAPGTGQNIETKVSLNEDGLTADRLNAKWEVGDQITIYIEDGADYKNNGNWEVHSVESDGKATFVMLSGNENKLLEHSNYCAVYPASTAATIAEWDNEKIYSTNLGDKDKWQNQTGNDNMSHLKGKLRMKTQPFSSTETMNFAHQSSILTFIFNIQSVLTFIAFADNYGDSEQWYYLTELKDVDRGEYKVHFIISPNPSASHKIAFEVPSLVNFRKDIATAFVAGKHYIIEKNPVMPTSVTLNNSTAEVPPGEALQLTATVLPEEVRNKSITWKSDNTGVATVDENGLVTIKKDCAIGTTATITATSKLDNSKTATCDITVIGGDILTLATINTVTPPASDVWIITDTDATASSKNEFSYLRKAMEKVAEGKSIKIIFPNLIQIPEDAFKPYPNSYKGSFKISAPKVTAIGHTAFENSGITSINFPELSEIGYCAFRGSKIAGAITIPGNIPVGAYAFEDCTELTSLSMPDVTKVSVGLVNGCTKLKTLSLPKLNEDISIYGGWRNLFKGCTALTKLEIATTQKVLFNPDVFSKISEEKGYSTIDLVTHADNITTKKGDGVGDALYYHTYSAIGIVGNHYIGPFKSVTAP